MAKISYSKLKCTVNENKVPVQIGENTIAVKQYLPINEKLELISNVINQAHEEDYNFANPVKIDVYTTMEIIFTYTDIVFTEKQKESFAKTYDQLYSSGIAQLIIDAIPEQELSIIRQGVKDSLNAFYEYQNSIYGILNNLKTDYSDLDLNVETIANKLTNMENMDLIKDVMNKMG